MEELIEHKGKIIRIEDNMIVVRILASSMCASCHAKGACITTDTKEKNIEVRTSKALSYNLGDEVVVCLSQRLGAKAVMIGFVFPFLVMFLTAFISNIYIFPSNEALTALLALVSIVIYYVFIYFMRNKIDNKFYFTIKE